jgi:hypothetical protein
MVGRRRGFDSPTAEAVGHPLFCAAGFSLRGCAGVDDATLNCRADSTPPPLKRWGTRHAVGRVLHEAIADPGDR